MSEAVTVPEIRVTGGEPPARQLVTALENACAAVEDLGGSAPLVVRLGGKARHGGFHDVDVHLVNKWERALRRVEWLGAVTVAVVDGECTGTALELLLCCDHRIASPRSVFGVPVAGTTPWPGMALHRLVQQIGLARARRLTVFGQHVDAHEAAEIGLVDDVVDDVASALARVLPRCDAVAGSEAAMRRRLLLEATSTGFDEALGAHLAACDRTLRREREQAPAERLPEW